MRDDGEWWFAVGSNELMDFEPEAFDGPFSSREEAIREAREDIVRELAQDGSAEPSFVIAHASFAEIPADIFAFRDVLFDWRCEGVKCSRKAGRELERMLADALKAWLTKHKIDMRGNGIGKIESFEGLSDE